MSKFLMTINGEDYQEVGWGELGLAIDELVEQGSEGDFMTMMFDDSDAQEDRFMQFMIHEKRSGKGFFGAKKIERVYGLEVRRGDRIFGKDLHDPQELKGYISDYYHSGRFPDISNWEVITEL
ncbi:MAG: hypothetical protein Q4A75_08670 [Peptostreptococcaceae bacterium]|nr:hypothetical protein [Peptostreptococcaceae bacterium]